MEKSRTFKSPILIAKADFQDQVEVLVNLTNQDRLEGYNKMPLLSWKVKKLQKKLIKWLHKLTDNLTGAWEFSDLKQVLSIAANFR